MVARSPMLRVWTTSRSRRGSDQEAFEPEIDAVGAEGAWDRRWPCDGASVAAPPLDGGRRHRSRMGGGVGGGERRRGVGQRRRRAATRSGRGPVGASTTVRMADMSRWPSASHHRCAGARHQRRGGDDGRHGEPAGCPDSAVNRHGRPDCNPHAVGCRSDERDPRCGKDSGVLSPANADGASSQRREAVRARRCHRLPDHCASTSHDRDHRPPQLAPSRTLT
jgi:hypothetical protein